MVLSTFQLIVKGVNVTYNVNKSMEFCNKKKKKLQLHVVVLVRHINTYY